VPGERDLLVRHLAHPDNRVCTRGRPGDPTGATGTVCQTARARIKSSGDHVWTLTEIAALLD